MKDKRERIMDAAYALFQQQGYQATSIQQIADYCSIAKGSVYSYFSSKQGLLIALLQRIDKRIVRDVLHFRSMKDIDKRQRYLLQIQAVLASTAEQRLFQAALSRGTLELSEELDQYNAAIQQQWLDLQVDSLIDYFGDACRPWLGDISLCLNGMIDSYCYLLIATQARIDAQKAAEIILLAAEGLVRQLQETRPSPAAEYDLIRSWLTSSENPENPDALSDLIQQLKNSVGISLASYTQAERDYAEGLLQALAIEIEQESPNFYLVRGLLTALYDFSELSHVCTVLQRHLGFPVSD